MAPSPRPHTATSRRPHRDDSRDVTGTQAGTHECLIGIATLQPPKFSLSLPAPKLSFSAAKLFFLVLNLSPVIRSAHAPRSSPRLQ